MFFCVNTHTQIYMYIYIYIQTPLHLTQRPFPPGFLCTSSFLLPLLHASRFITTDVKLSCICLSRLVSSFDSTLSPFDLLTFRSSEVAARRRTSWELYLFSRDSFYRYALRSNVVWMWSGMFCPCLLHFYICRSLTRGNTCRNNQKYVFSFCLRPLSRDGTLHINLYLNHRPLLYLVCCIYYTFNFSMNSYQMQRTDSDMTIKAGWDLLEGRFTLC